MPPSMLRTYEKKMDDYSVIMVKAIADRYKELLARLPEKNLTCKRHIYIVDSILYIVNSI